MKSLKSLKTPLRYPGGKSKAIKTLSQWYPKVITEYREPFIGGGSIAIDVTKANPDIPVWINDLYVPLYNFWVQLRDRGQDLSESVREQKEKMLESGTQEEKDKFAKELFNQYASEIDSYDNFQKAVAFFIMNKCSYSGLTENSTFSRTAANANFSLVGADKLAQFSEVIKNWKITNIDYSEVMNADGPENTFVFLDPPYDTEYREPFIGGGSIAIDVTKANPDIPVWINDLYVPLYNFWVQLRDRGQDLSESVREQKEKMLESGTQDEKDLFARNLFNQYAAEIDTYDDFQKAVAFFIMNKCSYSGLTENSTFSRTAANSNFSLVGADKLA